MTEFQSAAEERALAVASPAARPSQRRSLTDGGMGSVRVELSAESVRAKSDGSGAFEVAGVASVTETAYTMHDAFGPYSEIVSRDAFDKTLASSPLVEFTVNHGAGGGMPMAHTRNGTLVLTATERGLEFTATVDPSRTDVADMVKAMQRGDLAEASFKFRIDAGQWSPDYTEYRIDVVDLNRGDVSAVNFGANPHATSGLRAEHGPEVVVPERTPDVVRASDDEVQPRFPRRLA